MSTKTYRISFDIECEICGNEYPAMKSQIQDAIANAIPSCLVENDIDSDDADVIMQEIKDFMILSNLFVSQLRSHIPQLSFVLRFFLLVG